MGATNSTASQAPATISGTPRAAMIVSELVAESEAPFQAEEGPDRSAAALRALFAWDKFVENSSSVNIKAAGDADPAWAQQAEALIAAAVRSEVRLASIRFTAPGPAAEPNTEAVARPPSGAASARARSSRPKPSRRRQPAERGLGAMGAFCVPFYATRGAGAAAVRSQPDGQSPSPRSPAVVPGAGAAGGAAGGATGGATGSAAGGAAGGRAIPVEQQALLAGGSVLHCAALLGAVRLLAWAVQDPSLSPLLQLKDGRGLTPLALAASAQADLLRPLFGPQPLERGGTGGQYSGDSVLERARRLDAVISVLRQAAREGDPLPALASGLALALAHGSPALATPDGDGPSPSSAGAAVSSFASAADVTQHLVLYKLVALYESKMDASGHLLLSGQSCRLNNASLACAAGWALAGASSGKVEVPLSAKVLAALLGPLAHSSSLVHLDLSRLGMAGRLPTALGAATSLTYLDLFENKFTGAIPGHQLGSLPRLRGLNLASNALHGPIPGALFRPGKAQKHLWVLSLHSNLLTGVLPSSLFGCAKLKELWLSHNALHGALPEAVGGLTSLTTLVLAANDLSGKLPAGLSRLESLQGLYLQENKFSGRIPEGLLALGGLTSLDLRQNCLSGQLPAGLGRLESLERLHLGSNAFSGPIPPELGEGCRSLKHLYLDSNRLSGEVPVESLACPPGIITVALQNNPGILHRGRASKAISRLVQMKATRRLYPSSKATAGSKGTRHRETPKGVEERTDSSTPRRGAEPTEVRGASLTRAGGTDPAKHPLRRMQRIKVAILTIDPLAPYTDDAENWRV